MGRQSKKAESIFFSCILITMTFLVMSCSTYLIIDLDRKFDTTKTLKEKYITEVSANVRIDLAEFFVTYLEDLLGIEGVQGLIDLLEIKDYLESKDAISNVQVLAQPNYRTGKDSIRVIFQTDNLLNALESLDIPYSVAGTGDASKVSLNITREFVKNLLNNFSQVRDADLVSALMPEEGFVAEDKYAQYISWSFSDYAKESKIKSELNSSVILMCIKKGTNVLSPGLDSEWVYSKRLKGYQEIRLHFVPTLYSKKGALVEFTY